MSSLPCPLVAEVSSERASLSDAPISEVVRSIVANERSGDLIVEQGTDVRKVMFDRGCIVFAASTLDELRFGNLAVASGAMTKAQLDVALGFVKRDGCRIGKAMVTCGFFSQEEMETELERQIRTIATSVYALPEGTYRFDEHPCRIPEELRVRVSIYRVQLEGIRKASKLDLIETLLSPLDRFVKVTELPPFRLEDVPLEGAEALVHEAAQQPGTISALAEQIGEDRALTLRTVYGLLASGLLEITDAPAVEEVVAPPVAATPMTVAKPAEEAQPADARPVAPPRSENKEEISRLFNEIKIRKMVDDRQGVASMLRKVVYLAPDNPKYVGMLAKALAVLPNKAKEAEPTFRRALSLDPENAKLHYDFARYYQRMGMPSRALAELKTALRIDPGLSEARQAVVELKQKDEGVLTKSFKRLFS